MQAKVAWFDRDQSFIRQSKTGVSIHSHTSCSKESLEFVERFLKSHPLAEKFLQKHDRRSIARKGLHIEVSRAYWTPPASPRTAYELEKNQIEQKLGLRPLVSISDHDNIEAPLLLRVVPTLGDVPISLEWTVPFESAKFHLGVHNLPAPRADELLDQMKAVTAQPTTERVCDMLRTLHAIPEVLIVFNHPLWNLYGLAAAEFDRTMESFLALNNGVLHALELNGTRLWEENRRVAQLAARWQQLIISGGDRHGFEPASCLNLTDAATFSEWVGEIREQRISNLLFMPQYSHWRVARFYQTFLDAVRDYPEHPDGAVCWDQRTFHPGRDGMVRPMSELWDRVPGFIDVFLKVARLAETTRLLDKVRNFGEQPPADTSGILGQQEGA